MGTRTPHTQATSERLRAIPKWTRRYAQNRSLPFLLLMCIVGAGVLGLSASSYLTGEAYRAGDWVRFCLFLIPVLVLVGLILWMANPRRSGPWWARVSRRIYKPDGEASLSVPEGNALSRCRAIVPVLFLISVPALLLLQMHGYLREEHAQPASALLVVPFLVSLWFLGRPSVGWVPLLWASMYGLHAILVMAGAPIQFEGEWSILNFSIPVFGYGIVCGLLGHFYSRYSLKKLRAVAGSGVVE